MVVHVILKSTFTTWCIEQSTPPTRLETRTDIEEDREDVQAATTYTSSPTDAAPLAQLDYLLLTQARWNTSCVSLV